MTISIRQATPDDISAIAGIHVTSKRAAYAGIVAADFLASKTQKEYEGKWQGWLGEDGIMVSIISDTDKPCGFISYGRMQTPPPGTSKIRPQYTAEIFAIHIHPDYWRKGLGSKLLRHAVQILRDDKHQSLCLWVLAQNERAIKFYDTLGGKRLGKRNVEVGPNKLKELCYGWREIDVIFNQQESS